ncbi:DUF2061 domain-containing protein [Thalassolituus maritimus]|uniref:DUF2061 domain-containing protein n=1 Tax=Thalassolituus maritimus TaxID=484498 RepID=A0ABP9ZVU1_9GAMM
MTKTISFAVMHFAIAFSVAYLLSGSFVIGGAIAIVEPAVNTVGYYFHEKLWNRQNQNRGQSQNQDEITVGVAA